MDSFAQNAFTTIGFGVELFFVETGVCIRRKVGEVGMTQMAYFLLFELIAFAVAINISILVIVCKTHNILRGTARKIKKGLEGNSHERTSGGQISQ